MHDKLLYPVFKLIHKPDGCAMLLELSLHAIAITRRKKKSSACCIGIKKKLS